MFVDYIDDLAWAAAASIDLLILFGIGVYFLFKRFQRREEIAPLQEAAVLGLAMVLATLEIRFLREALERLPVYYVFSAIGVLISVSALYGHLVVSLLSRFLVEWVTTGTSDGLDRPLFGAAEACMRRGDYEGAVREYLVLARLHPRDPAVFMRLGEALSLTHDCRRAVPAFVRCAMLETNGDRAIHALRRALDHLASDSAQQRMQLLNALSRTWERFAEDKRLTERIAEMHRQLGTGPAGSGPRADAQTASAPTSTLLQKLDDQPINDS